RFREGIAASRAGSSRPCGRARTGVAAVGRAKGRHPSDPIPAGRRRTAERARLSRDTTAASTGPAIARDERAAAAVGHRHSDKADNAFCGNRTEQPISGTIASAHEKAGGANVAVGRGTAGDTLIRAYRRCQTWNAAVADAGCNNALSRGRAGDVNTVACRTHQAENAAI